MINVVFLLLIFFLMTARIAPPDAFDVTLPDGGGAPATPETALVLTQDGIIGYGRLRGDAAVQAAVQAGPVTLRADAGADAADLANLLRDLGLGGARDITLLTQAAP